MPHDISRKIRCGVIGAGWWATYAHIPALLEDPRAELAAIQSRTLDAARKIAKDFGVPRAYASADELLRTEDLDAVVVATSPHLHYENARAALSRGCHTLVEKPMTITAGQAHELVELAAERDLQLLISAPWHYTRHGREARRLALRGELGEVRMISVLMTNPVDHLIRGSSTKSTHGKPYLEPERGTYSDPQIAGGGQIYAQVSHAAAYLTYLTGARPARVFARFHNDGTAMDIYDALDIEMENGCLASISSTGVTAFDQRDFEVRVYGTGGTLFLELWRGSMSFVRLDGRREDYPNLAAEEVYPERAPARNLIDSVLSPSANISPGTLGLAAMEIIEAACSSALSDSDIIIRVPAPVVTCNS